MPGADAGTAVRSACGNAKDDDFLTDLDDSTLVEHCLAGNGAAWEALVRRYQRLVYTIVTRMGLDEHVAADVFQTVFTRLIQHLPRIGDPSRLKAWIVTTAKREGLLQLRRSHRTESMSGEDGDDEALQIPDGAPLPEEQLAELQALDALRAALERLDDRCRDLLTMIFRDDDDRVPYDEVSRRLGIPVGSIGPTRQRCLDKLRRLAP